MNRTPLHAFGTVAVALALSLSLAACGSSGGGKGSAKGTSTPAAASFTTQANAVCKTANGDIAAIEAKFADDDSAQTLADFDSLTARMTKLVADLKALEAPADKQADVTSLLDTVTGIVANAKSQGPTFLAQGDPFATADAKATALGLDECAGNSNDATTGASPTSLTSEQFKSQANAICGSASTKLHALNPGTSPSDAQLDTAFAAAADVLYDEVAKIRALSPPSDLKSDVDAFLDALTSAADHVKTNGHLLTKESTSPFADSDAKANALGLDKCTS